MHKGDGQLIEIYLDSGGRINCPQELIPAPGTYLLAHAEESDYPLSVPLFLSESTPGGFRTAPPLSATWKPGTRLCLRGPLGHGFTLPASARRAALVAFDDSPARLRGLIPLSLKQDAAVTLVCDSVPEDLAEEVEVQPMKSLGGILKWADYVAVDVARENLPVVREILKKADQSGVLVETQILIRTPMPCGTYAECGICAVTLKDGWIMVCKDGPVFDFVDLK